MVDSNNFKPKLRMYGKLGGSMKYTLLKYISNRNALFIKLFLLYATTASKQHFSFCMHIKLVCTQLIDYKVSVKISFLLYHPIKIQQKSTM